MQVFVDGKIHGWRMLQNFEHPAEQKQASSPSDIVLELAKERTNLRAQEILRDSLEGTQREKRASELQYGFAKADMHAALDKIKKELLKLKRVHGETMGSLSE
jgi:hypothetical protein